MLVHPLFAVLAVASSSTLLVAQSIAIHVAPGGDDGAPGDAARPVRSLTRAQALVRERRSAPTAADVEVVLHAGTWRLEAPLLFGPEDGGDDAHGVTWRAEGEVVVSGGRRIDGWRQAADGTWTATVPAGWRLRELFVDGWRRPRARYPNDGWLRVRAASADRRTGFTFAPGDLAPVADLAAVELVFLHDWSISRVGIAAIDAATASLTTRDPIGGAAPHYAIDNFEPHPRYFVENARAWLDAAGEWFLDADRGVLSYLPLPGEDIGSVAVVAPVAPRLVDVRGRDGAPVRNLVFDGIAFEHAAWAIPARGYAEGQANYHEPRTADSGILRAFVPAALHFENAVDSGLRNARITRVGGAGLAFGSRCARCFVTDSVVDDVSGNGILVGEDQVRHIGDRVWWQVAPEQITTDVRVERCAISRCGQQFFGAVGVWVGFARGARIVGNTIEHLPYTGVSLGWIWNPTPTPCGGHVVADNHIHHVMQVLSDGGGVYTLGRQPGTVIARNRIHDVPVNLGRAESNGMFLDEGTTDVVIEDNQIWSVDRSPLRFHRATTNLVRGNLLVVRGDVPAVRYDATDPGDIRLEANVVAREVESGGR